MIKLTSSLGILSAVLLSLLVPTRVAAAERWTVGGFGALRGVAVEGQPGWLEGGFGRSTLGADAAGDDETFALGEVHVTLEYSPSPVFGVLVHLTGRAEPDEIDARAAGVIEAYVHGAVPVRRRDELRFKLGHFFLQTSRENVETGWSTPYTLTFSALNTWIGEEVRPTGLQAEYGIGLGAADELRIGGSTFVGNDSSGALLAWRGWSLGDRPTTYGEKLPLPPIDSLSDTGEFAAQSDDGTLPFGSDLDDRLGWVGYLRWQRPGRVTVQYTHINNRGDRGFHEGEYAWDTEFDLVGADLHLGNWSFAAEALEGETGMGTRGAAKVQLDMSAAYLLASWRGERVRFTARYDTFDATEQDFTGTDDNDDDGEAWTVALFWEPTSQLRLGAELVDLAAQRPEAAASGFDPDTDFQTIKLELRYYFDF